MEGCMEVSFKEQFDSGEGDQFLEKKVHFFSKENKIFKEVIQS